MKAFIFECSTATYLDCMQKGLFGSNLPWPLQIMKADFCCLYQYEVGTLFALWQATSDGGKNLVPKAWGGRFPFQAIIARATPEIVSILKADIAEAFLNPSTGKFDNVLEGERAESFLAAIQNSRAK
jgi:hypothetical protein